MEERYIKDIEAYIDPAIEDIWLRVIDWQINVYTFTGQMDKVMRAKWNRAAYLQGGAQ